MFLRCFGTLASVAMARDIFVACYQHCNLIYKAQYLYININISYFIKVNLCVCVCVFVCVSGIEIHTVGPILTKFGMGT